VAVFGGEADEIGEQHQPVRQPAGSQPNDEDFAVSPARCFRNLSDFFQAPIFPIARDAGKLQPNGRSSPVSEKFSRWALPETTIPASMVVFLRNLWTFIRPYQFRLFLGLVFGILYGLANCALMAAVKVVVKLIFQGSAEISVAEELAKLPGFLQPLAGHLVQWLPQIMVPSSRTGMLLIVAFIPAVMLVRVLCGYLNIYLTNWSAARAVADLRTRLFAHLQDMPLAFFSKASTGDLISRITSDTQALYGIIGGVLSSLVRDPTTLIFMMAFLLWTDWKLTLISLVVLPVCIVPIVVYGRKIRKAARAIQSHTSDLARLMHESFTGNRIIKAYNLEDAVLAQFRQTTGQYINQALRVLRASEIPSQLMEFLASVGVALVLLYLIFHGNRPRMEDFVAFIGGVFLMYQPFKNLTRLHNQIHQAEAASQRVFELLNTKSTLVDPLNPVVLQSVGADIRFENVDFDYGDKPVLRGINLTVRAGQLVALVGSSGSGKTTLVNLLPRFYDPLCGAVRIGTTDIRQVSLKDLRRQIAMVTQETILFHESICRNIELGRPGATGAEIEAAARAANAHEFIMQKPDGYETIAGEKGAVLSGGQRQRITIARAILKDAPILILDEATSALDTESERVVQAALEKLMQGRTTICIAHRLSTIQKADLIVVLDQGRIVETGRHAELIQRGGIYQKLYELQFQS
jgi:subfamily B ATP-binding cassette protein MsbA